MFVLLLLLRSSRLPPAALHAFPGQPYPPRRGPYPTSYHLWTHAAGRERERRSEKRDGADSRDPERWKNGRFHDNRGVTENADRWTTGRNTVRLPRRSGAQCDTVSSRWESREGEGREKRCSVVVNNKTRTLQKTDSRHGKSRFRLFEENGSRNHPSRDDKITNKCTKPTFDHSQREEIRRNKDKSKHQSSREILKERQKKLLQTESLETERKWSVTAPKKGGTIKIRDTFKFEDGDSTRSREKTDLTVCRGKTDEIDRSELGSVKPISAGIIGPQGREDLRSKNFSLLHGKSTRRVRKSLEAQASEALEEGIDDKSVGDDWIKKRLCWLFREIPCLRTPGIIRILNDQRKWIKEEHAKQIINNLVHKTQFVRAHRVHKWMQQQQWYKFDFELNNNLAAVLGRNAKISRARDLFDEILNNGKFPDAATFTVLIKAYIQDGEAQSIGEAWKLYNQMIQRHGHNTSVNLQEPLFKALVSNEMFLEQAEILFDSMKAASCSITIDIYTSLIKCHGQRGEHEKIDALRKEMKEKGFPANLDVLNAVLDACTKDGDKCKAEDAFQCLIESGINPDWRTYVSLIRIYGKASLHLKSLETFDQMKKHGMFPNFSAYEAIVAVMANALERKHVENLLKQAEESCCKPMQPCYSAAMEMYLRLKMYKEVESIHERMKARNVRPTRAACNFLVNSYIQSGQLKKAEALFKEMKAPGGIGVNMLSYNFMLEGYAISRLKEKVKVLFEEMMQKGLQVDSHVNLQMRGLLSVHTQTTLKMKTEKLSDELREIIAGMLLGGAYAESWDEGQTFQLRFEFSTEKKAGNIFKEHLHQLFLRWLKPQYQFEEEGQESTVPLGGDNKKCLRLETVSHGSFRFYALQYRHTGAPVIPRLIHRWLKPRTLAYWYMYGGCKCQATGGIILAAANYSPKEIQRVVKVLKVRPFDCKIRKRSNGYSIRFEGTSAFRLWQKMEPHILEELKKDLKPGNVSLGIMNTGLKNDIYEGDSDEDTKDGRDFYYAFDNDVSSDLLTEAVEPQSQSGMVRLASWFEGKGTEAVSKRMVVISGDSEWENYDDFVPKKKRVKSKTLMLS